MSRPGHRQPARDPGTASSDATTGPVVAGLVDTGLSSWWAPALAFAAGVVSFASPCVLPLVPGYVSFVTGGRATEGEGRRPLLPILLFILGFTIVFTLLGAFAGTFVRFFRDPWFQRVAGLVVVVLGLLMLGYALGRGSAALLRGAAAAPRAGPPGHDRGAPARGGVRRRVDALHRARCSPGSSRSPRAAGRSRGGRCWPCTPSGSGCRSCCVGLGADWVVPSLGWVRRHYRAIAAVSGAFLVAVGVLLMTGTFQRLIAPLARFAPGSSPMAPASGP